jgi:hypothetical protein
MIINSYIFGGFDADAQAFITAAAITDNTQKNAINNLVINLKAAGIWSKMKAVYPFVGGTAATHKFNLKNPADTNAAFRLSFIGGWTHTATGALPNGTNAYANTFLDTQNDLSLNSGHFSFYSRTNLPTAAIRIDMGALRPSPDSYSDLNSSNSNLTYFRFNNGVAYDSVASANSTGFYIGSRTASNIIKTYKNGSTVLSGTAVSSSTSNIDIYIGAVNSNGSPLYYANRECALASIGDSLTDTEALVFNQIVEGYQYELSRNINAVNVNYYNTAYNNETNAFLYASEITNTTQKSAVNSLVNDLKTAGIWTKMKAVYPFIGGTASTHKWNLVNPQDTNAAFRLVFFGGWTHTSNGVQANGTNGYADTFLVPNTTLAAADSVHLSVYSRTDQAAPTDLEMGTYDGNSNSLLGIGLDRSASPTGSYGWINNANVISFTDTNSAAFYVATRVGSVQKIFRNLVTGVSFTNAAALRATTKIFIANAYSQPFSGPDPGLYSNKQYAFMSIGDGLTDTDASNFYTAVQAFNTTLARQV